MQFTSAKQKAHYTGSVPVWAVSDEGRTTSFHQGEVQLEMTRFKKEPNDPFVGTFWVNKGVEIRNGELPWMKCSWSPCLSLHWMTVPRSPGLQPPISVCSCLLTAWRFTHPDRLQVLRPCHICSYTTLFLCNLLFRFPDLRNLFEFQFPLITKKKMKAPVSPIFVVHICGADVS